MARTKATKDQPELEQLPETPQPEPAREPKTLVLPDIVEFLMCPLTDAEIKTRGEELARAIKARDEADGQRKAAAEQVKVHQESIDRLKTAILYKQEQRDVPCRQTADVEHLAVDITRNDTGEFVRRRELELFERQPTLGFTVEVKEDPPEKQ